MNVQFKNNGKINVIAVDVRGTLIDPYEDLVMGLEISNCLWKFVNGGGFVGVITATSLKSLQTLMIPQLLTSLSILKFNSDLLAQFVFYVDSGTAAYRLNTNGNPIAVENYPFISFNENQVNLIIESIKLACRDFPWAEAVWKIKAGQVNYYCGGSWNQRIALAKFLKTSFLTDAEELFVMVPSAKDTIDIALRDKSYPTQDLLSRSASKSNSLLILGDSLQMEGADLDMLLVAKQAQAVQVGAFKPVPQVLHVPIYGPEGSLLVLREVLQCQ